jgi:subtilase family serine protease
MASNSLPRLFVASLLCLGTLAGLGQPSAQAQVHNRISGAVAGSSLVAIAHSIHPKAKLGSDLGPTAGDKELRGMTIRFNMTDAQTAALDQLLNDQQNPASPRYHQWLTPAQYGAQFGMSSADLAKVSGWLAGQGFTVTGVANGGTFISFDGTVAQVESAFGTSIHNLSVDGETHFANVTDISVPSAFAGVVSAVNGLHDFRLKPRIRASLVDPVVDPHFTSSITGNHYTAPGDIYTIYNMNPLLATYTGAGITIAVTGQVDIYTADISAFRSASGLSTSNLPTTVHAFGTDPGYPTCSSDTCTRGPGQGDLTESSIDLEWSGAMAPAATVVFVNSSCALPGGGCGGDAMTYAIDNNSAPIVTTSYGLCEAGWGTTDLISSNALFKQANVQGQTIIAASADQGATDCDAGPTATEGLAVDFPASSPYVTGLGGTQFNEGNATGATSYWSSTNGTVGQGSAISYIPEQPWNDESLGSYGGGGGGASNFFTKPTWQVGTGVPSDGARDVPDISLNASNAHDSLLLCVNVATGVSCGSGFRQSTTSSTLDVEGGTSYDSQIFGGMLALIEQKIGSRVGNANLTLYALANNTVYYTPGMNFLTLPTVVFNDVTSGNNSMLCAAGSANCSGGTEGYTAGNGYDLASGWGSVNLTNLANAWNLVKPLGVGSLGANISVTTLTASASSVAAGGTVTLTASVTGSAGTPTGSVQFFANHVALGSAVALSANGVATYSWVTSCSALGLQVLSASYSGDANYQGSIGPVLTAGGGNETSNGSTQTAPLEVQVSSSTCADFSISTTTPTVTVAAGGTIPSVTISVAPVNNFSGTVTFSAVSTSTSGYGPTFTFSPTSVNLTSSASASTTLTLSGITASLQLPGVPGHADPGTMMATAKSHRMPWHAAGSGIAIASLLLLMVPGRRRLSGLLLVLLSVGLIGGTIGCSSSQSAPPTTTTTTSTNPYVGTYTVTVTGSYTGTNNQVTQHAVVVTYNIN